MESQVQIQFDCDKDVFALGSATHLEREKAYSNLVSVVLPELITKTEEEQEQKVAVFLASLNQLLSQDKWEFKYASLVGYKALVSFQGISQNCLSIVCKSVEQKIFNDQTFLEILQHDEVRLSQQLGQVVQNYFHTQSQDKEVKGQQFIRLQDILHTQQTQKLFEESKKLTTKENQEQNLSKEGFLKQNSLNKQIEANLSIYKSLIESAGISQLNFSFAKELLEFYDRNQSRHIRELNQYLLLSVLQHISIEAHSDIDLVMLTKIISSGMEDNWSQVRFAAAQASRRIYDIIKCDQEYNNRGEIDKLLIPRICFNRHYMADGIRNYNQETWKQVVGQEGKQYLCRLSAEVKDFYISQLRSENFQVRESSTECFDEIFRNVASEYPEIYSNYLDEIVRNLLQRIKDTQWQVRKGVFMSLSEIFKIYQSSDIENCLYQKIKEEGLKYLSENIPTVREAAAVLLGVLSAKDNDLRDQVNQHLLEKLLSAKLQKPIQAQSSIPYDVKFDVDRQKSQLEEQKTPQLITPNIATHLKDVDDPGFAREEQLWEISDGCIYLFREVSKNLDGKIFSKLIQQLPDLGYLDQFSEASLLKENLYRALAEIIKKIGKKGFRPYVELFIDPLFRAAKEPRYNCQYPAQELVMTLVKEYGESIMRAVVESHDDRLLGDLNQIIQQSKSGHFSQQQKMAGFIPQSFPLGAGTFQGNFQVRY